MTICLEVVGFTLGWAIFLCSRDEFVQLELDIVVDCRPTFPLFEKRINADALALQHSSRDR